MVMNAKTMQTEAPPAQSEITNLLERLAQAEASLEAMRKGKVDALGICESSGDQVLTLKGSEKHYRLLIEAMNEGALTILADGTILYCNPRFAEMVQTPIKKIIGGSLYHFVEIKDHSSLQRQLRQIPSVGVKAEFTLCATCSTGVRLPAQLSLRPLDVQGVSMVAVVATDQTDRKRYEEKLRIQKEELEQRVATRTAELTQVNEALQAAQEELHAHARELEQKVTHRTAELQATVSSLEQFCYTIAHDLRAPLRTMHGFSSALLDDFAPALNDVARGYARRITDASTRMDEQIRALLAYGRLNSSEMPLISTDPGPLLEQLAKSEEFKHARVDLRTPLPKVFANPIALRQVMENLLGNAVKFVAAGTVPQVCVSAKAQGDTVRLLIEDNGIGIDPKYHHRIFKVFERVTGSAYPGTGIGLAIVQKGVERMGGRVGVESEPGKGSRFWIELRKADEASETPGSTSVVV